MKAYRWDADRNEALSACRGISFERIVVAIESSGLMDVLVHPNPARYPRQRILVVVADGYAYLVPFIDDEDYFFLKTIIPSRKATRNYLKSEKHDGED